MNQHMLTKMATCLVLLIAIPICAHAGKTTITTSDDAPTYPTTGNTKNTEVVIKNTKTVTLATTTDDEGALTITYTPSSGVTKTSDTGGEEGAETAVFSFDSTTVGKVNTIVVSVQHNSGADPSKICSSSATATFTICIPKITVTRPSGDTTTNTFENSVFENIVTISGCDDFNQIEWVQMFTDQQDYTDYSGSFHNIANYTSGTIDWPTNHSGWASPGGTSGWSFSISDSTATLNPPDGHGDGTPMASTGSFQIGGVGPVYYYTVSSSIACTFQDKVRRTGDTSGNILAGYDWSYSWDNHNIAWPASPNTPTMAQYTTATGHTSGVYGGTARSGTGANAGHWTNVQNISVP